MLRRTEYIDPNISKPHNSKNTRQSLELDYSTNDNNPLLTKIEKNRHKKEKTIINLLKSDNLNLNKIILYLNKNNISFPKLKRNSIMNIENKFNLFFNKSLNKKQKEVTKESNNIKANKNKFVFNNQKIFSSLLNNFKLESNKKDINYTLKDEKNTINYYENKNENSINNKYNNTEIKGSNKYKRNKRKNLLSLMENNSLKGNNNKKLIEENYKDIFFVDCLCLDKWEEKNNKFQKKKQYSLKGKKISYFNN